MTSAYKLNDLTPVNKRYYADDEHRFLLIGAGRRSRKTLIAKRKLLLRALSSGPEKRYFHAAPTRDQAKRIFWNDLKKYASDFIKDKSDGELWVKLYNDSEIHIVGLDKPQRIEGQPWHGCHITEIANVKPDAWGANIRPGLSDTNGWAILDGVPEMGNFWYRDMVKNCCGGVIPETIPQDGAFGTCEEWKQWAFYSWFSSDVLPVEEIEEAKRTLDDKVFRQEYEGSFETLEGQVYYGFTADYHPHGNLDKDVCFDENMPVYLFMDFNVSPMTALLCHVKNGDELHVFNGYHLKSSNTKGTIERILSDYQKARNFICITCQSGANKQTMVDATITDRRIIMNMMNEAGKSCRMMHRTKNPPIMSRIHAVNAKLSHNKIRINPESNGCKWLIKDLEGLTYKEGTSEVDKTDPLMEHISSALGYGVERLWPIRSNADMKDYENYTF